MSYIEVKNVTIKYDIFQNYGLLPWRTVESNVALGLEVLDVPENERESRIAAALETVGLGKFRNHRPNQLSGGMKQPIIFVTHDIEEAVYLSDRIVVLTPNPGRLKGVINISMPQADRERTSADFIKARAQVFDIFNKNNVHAIEYFI